MIFYVRTALNHEKEDSITTLSTLFSALASIQDCVHQTEQSTKNTIFNALHYLKNNYFNDIHIESLATSFGYSRAHFTTLFIEETWISPYLYLTQIRIKKAKELLSSTKLSIEEIGYSVGSCASLSNFEIQNTKFKIQNKEKHDERKSNKRRKRYR